MWPFRRPQTPQDGPDRHQVTLDLVEQVAVLRGQVGSLEIEWGNVKDIVQKSYQRMEKANQRQERRHAEEDGNPPEKGVDRPEEEARPALHGFALKLERLKGG